MYIHRKWIGHIEAEDLSGVAIIEIDGHEYRLHLDSFSEFTLISKMLDKAYAVGRKVAYEDVEYFVEGRLAP